MMKAKKRICFVVAVPETAEAFLKDHIKALSDEYDIYLVANMTGVADVKLDGLSDIKHIPIRREINILNDLKSVYKLTSYFREMKFDAVHSVTPKAGLVTALAARMAGIEDRTHIFTGQVWATRTGLFRFLLKSIDKVIVVLNNHILVDGEAQRQFLISEGVLSQINSRVLGAGSICGANTAKFTPEKSEREKQRKELGLDSDKVVFAFMGRLKREKGIFELLQAFNNLVQYAPDAYMLFFGNDEDNCMSNLSDYPNIIEGSNFKYCGVTSVPQLSLQAADVFCLPSYREGFGMSVIEASCLGLPVICSDTYALADTMVDNETGLRCKVKDVETLEKAMKFLYDNPPERKRMGENGRKRVLELFSGEIIVNEWVKFYNEMLK